MDNIFIELEKRDILSRKCERALLVEIKDSHEDLGQAEAHLKELNSLVLTMGIEPIASAMIKLRKVHSSTLIGKGKIEELIQQVDQEEADILIFDYELSPSQQRNLEKIFGITVIDRQEVILDIFADRASTKEAHLQVALARMEYSLPRLTRAWTHLSRQRGGAKGTRGKGETQLETDRRLVLDRIAKLKKEITRVRKNRDTQRKKRDNVPFPQVAIVGYTNAGKSTLLNQMTGADALAEDKLFATLDTTSRSLKMKGGREIILTDTVGFVRKLPHMLVDAFMSTLEEAARADIILNVVDGSSPERESHMETTAQVLSELNATQVPQIVVVNKADQMEDHWLSSLVGESREDPVLVSAATGEGINLLIDAIEAKLNESKAIFRFCFEHKDWDKVAFMHRKGTILQEEYHEDQVWIEVMLSPMDAQKYLSFQVKDFFPSADK